MDLLIPALLAAIALTVVLLPVLRGRRVPPLDGAAVDAEIGRYRESLRSGTVCEHCAEANPPGSRFCARCGRALIA